MKEISNNIKNLIIVNTLIFKELDLIVAAPINRGHDFIINVALHIFNIIEFLKNNYNNKNKIIL